MMIDIFDKAIYNIIPINFYTYIIINFITFNSDLEISIKYFIKRYFRRLSLQFKISSIYNYTFFCF